MSVVSVKDVARRAGVSVGTVSNVMNYPEKVAVATVERVHAAIEELGYIRNDAARQLREGRSKTIGLVVLDVRNPFFTDIARGAEDRRRVASLSRSACDRANRGSRRSDRRAARVHGMPSTRSTHTRA